MLKVWTDGTDTFVAEDLDDLRRVKSAYLSATNSPDDPWDPTGDMGAPGDFDMVPPEKAIAIRYDDAPTKAEEKRTQTALEWAIENGRGLLCSTEF